MMKKVFLLCFIIYSPYFVPPCLSCKQLLKTFVNLTKFGTEKHTTLQLALNLQYKRKSEKTHLLKRIFLHREKDETKNLSPFLCKRPFDHGKEFLKSSQLHFKEFHFKSTSSSSSKVEKQASH